MNEYARQAAWYQLGTVAENKRAGSLAARGLDTSIPDVARIRDFKPGREGPSPAATPPKESSGRCPAAR
jgi:hypothetical protein